MMTKDEIAAFWKLGATISSAPKEALETPELMQAQMVYEQLKDKMVEEIHSQKQGVDAQPQESIDPKLALVAVSHALNELCGLERAQFNQATPKEDIEKFEAKWSALSEAMAILKSKVLESNSDSLKNPET